MAPFMLWRRAMATAPDVEAHRVGRRSAAADASDADGLRGVARRGPGD